MLRAFIKITLLVFTVILMWNSCDIFEGPCADEDLGQLFLQTDIEDINPYHEDLLIYFKDSAGNEVTFEFIYKNVFHMIDGPSSHNVPCESNSSKRKEYKARIEAYEFSISEPESSLELSFHLDYRVDLGYLNGIMVTDMLGVFMWSDKDNNTSGTGSGYGGYGWASIGGIRLIVNPRGCTAEYLARFPKPKSEIELLSRTFQNAYVGLDSKIYYNYEFGIIAFRDETNNLWVLDRMEKNE